ncbi:MAG: PhnD/SsuA/transferrin family substrate-binding protein [Myxococcaceae bacterium]|nr:PhnD/SsuA/transferrin family substrate-binding protein [Myxococcaceae bacterium]
MSDAGPPVAFERRHLGRYELVHRLDVGGMAEIFLALDRGPHGFERLVVIKRSLAYLAAQPTFREMFLQEARWVARLTHPNIVQIHELGEAGGAPYIVMEHVLGVTVRDLVRSVLGQGRQFPPGVVTGLMAQACAGAHAAHELADPDGRPLGLVHRDISPHNLMVTATGHVKLLDFGIAKATELGTDATRSGTLKGKLHYMSPEQVQQQKLDRRSDVFALGVVTWELLTGRRLFKRDTDLETMQAIITADAWLPTEFREGLPAPLVQVVMKALSRDPADRQATADVLRRELEAAADASALKHGPDELAAFVLEAYGDVLRANEAELKRAVERAKVEGFSDEDRTAWNEPAKEQKGSNTFETLPRASLSTRVSQRVGLSQRELWLAALLAGVAVLLGGGLGYRLRRPPLTGPELRLGWAPTVDVQVLTADLEPLRRHLERETGRPVVLIYPPSYHELAAELLDGGVHFASLPPVLFVRTERRDPRVHAVALKLVGGASGTDGVLLASDSSGISSIADLKGRTFCIPDEDSTTGNLFPRMAARRAGLDWGKDVTVVKSGNHLQVLRDLASRRCAAGGTYSGAFVNAVTQGIDVSTLRQIAITGRSPQDTIVAGPGVAEAELPSLKRALFSYKAPPEAAGAIERITGFIEPSRDDYATLREAIAADEGASP